MKYFFRMYLEVHTGVRNPPTSRTSNWVTYIQLKHAILNHSDFSAADSYCVKSQACYILELIARSLILY
jgi:hypothetical protein